MTQNAVLGTRTEQGGRMVQRNSEGCMGHLPDLQAQQYKTCDKDKSLPCGKIWGSSVHGREPRFVNQEAE